MRTLSTHKNLWNKKSSYSFNSSTHRFSSQKSQRRMSDGCTNRTPRSRWPLANYLRSKRMRHKEDIELSKVSYVNTREPSPSAIREDICNCFWISCHSNVIYTTNRTSNWLRASRGGHTHTRAHNDNYYVLLYKYTRSTTTILPL